MFHVEHDGGSTRARRLHAAALGYFWLPCPACGRHFSGEEWMTPEKPGAHFASIPTDVRQDADHGYWARSRQGICPSCTVAGVGCKAHAAHRIYHPGCEAVPPPEGDDPYVMERRTPWCST